MGSVEHVTATAGLLLWFLALGWHFAGGQLLDSSRQLLDSGPLAVATWVLLGSAAVDKIVSGLFRRRFGREIFDYRRVDALFHLIAARRNVHLLLLTVGVALNRPEVAFAGMTVWMLATLLFHASRYGWTAFAEWRENAGAG